MSRSHRHSPVIPWTCAESEKRDKVLAHRAFRRVTRQALHMQEWEILPHPWTWADPYKWEKDGKCQYWDGDIGAFYLARPWRFWMK